MELWVLLAISAAFFQSLRNAGQKYLSSKVDPVLASGARFIFGFPFALSGLLLSLGLFGSISPNWTFWIYSISSSTTQVLGSICVTYLFRRRNFAIGGILLRSEVVFVPILSFILLSETISSIIILALLVSMLGTFIASLNKIDLSLGKKAIQVDKTSLFLGFLGGFFFALTMVCIRGATTHGFDGKEPAILRAITILSVMLFFQSTVLLSWLAITKPHVCYVIKANIVPCIFNGLMSALASFCWFFSYTLVAIPQVKIVGQIEFIFLIFITFFYFKEKISRLEWIGAAFILLATFITLVHN